MTSFNLREIVQAVIMVAAVMPGIEVVLGYKEGGFQSGPSPGAMYAGGLKYDTNWDTLYITGSHYNVDFIDHDGSSNDLMVGTELDGESSCYIGMLDMDSSSPTTTGDDEAFHTLTNWRSYGDPGVMETCSAVTTDENKHAFIVGSVAKNGFFHKVKNHPIVALTAVVQKNDLEFVNAAIASSENLNNNKNLLYPLAVIHSDTNDQVLYVAALTSVDKTQNPISGQPNWQETQKIGSAFYLSVLKWKIKNNNKKEPQLQWIQDFPMDVEPDGITIPDVYIGGMLLQQDSNGFEHLLIAGSTRGTGKGYGEAEVNSDDEDGFIMQLSPKDGSFLFHKRHKGKKKKNNNKDNIGTNNLREGTGSDDLIRGICHSSNVSVDEFYIVGGTKGDMTNNDQGEQNNLNEVNNAGFQFGASVESKYRELWDREESLQPFLRRVSFQKELAPVWTTQWAAMPNLDLKENFASGALLKTNAFAMDCVVDATSNSIYVVGSVLNGAQMTQGDIEMINQGGDDIWVAKVDEKTGNVHWLTQLGNFGDENPARHKSIAINNAGNVIIYGDTTSNLYRARDGAETSSTSDMFIMVVDGETGAVNDNFYMGGTSSASVSGSVNGVVKPPPNAVYDGVDMSGGDDDDGQSVPSIEDVMNDGPNSAQKDESKTQPASKGKSNTGKVFGILFGIIAALCAIFFVFKQRQKTKNNESQKSSIFSCLQKFDVEDIDLRRSPPGGWHGTYMNKLAYGVNNADRNNSDDGIIATDLDPGSYRDDIDADDGAPLNSHSHSSIANDSLFVDSASSSKPSLGSSAGYKDNAYEEDEVDIHLRGKDLI